MTAAREALEVLRRGNRRFAAGSGGRAAADGRARRGQLVAGQSPFAIVVGCSDSRVPVEIVFDQGLGDLFVARVAGNVVTPSLLGSVEFAAERFGTRLVVILGHSGCGAVAATLEDLEHPVESPSPNLRAILARIRPSVEGLMATDPRRDRDALLEQAVRSNIRASMRQLRHESATLKRLVENDGLLIAGAEYSLETGLVDFFDGVPGGV